MARCRRWLDRCGGLDFWGSRHGDHPSTDYQTTTTGETTQVKTFKISLFEYVILQDEKIVMQDRKDDSLGVHCRLVIWTELLGSIPDSAFALQKQDLSSYRLGPLVGWVHYRFWLKLISADDWSTLQWLEFDETLTNNFHIHKVNWEIYYIAHRQTFVDTAALPLVRCAFTIPVSIGLYGSVWG